MTLAGSMDSLGQSEACSKTQCACKSGNWGGNGSCTGVCDRKAGRGSSDGCTCEQMQTGFDCDIAYSTCVVDEMKATLGTACSDFIECLTADQDAAGSLLGEQMGLENNDKAKQECTDAMENATDAPCTDADEWCEDALARATDAINDAIGGGSDETKQPTDQAGRPAGEGATEEDGDDDSSSIAALVILLSLFVIAVGGVLVMMQMKKKKTVRMQGTAEDNAMDMDKMFGEGDAKENPTSSYSHAPAESPKVNAASAALGPSNAAPKPSVTQGAGGLGETATL